MANRLRKRIELTKTTHTYIDTLSIRTCLSYNKTIEFLADFHKKSIENEKKSILD